MSSGTFSIYKEDCLIIRVLSKTLKHKHDFNVYGYMLVILGFISLCPIFFFF